MANKPQKEVLVKYYPDKGPRTGRCLTVYLTREEYAILEKIANVRHHGNKSMVLKDGLDLVKAGFSEAEAETE